MLWEFIDPQYLKAKLDLIDISLTSLRDAIRGPGARTLTDIYDATSSLSGKFPSAVTLADNLGNPTTTIVGSALLGFDGSNWRRVALDTSGRIRINAELVANPPNFDVPLSTRASESTLSGIKAQTDRLTFDAAGRLAIQNPPNLDVALSSRASESTLSALNGKFPSAVALGDAIGNPTTTIIGGALLGFDGANWRRVHVRALDILGSTGGALAVVDFLTPSRQPVLIDFQFH